MIKEGQLPSISPIIERSRRGGRRVWGFKPDDNSIMLRREEIEKIDDMTTRRLGYSSMSFTDNRSGDWPPVAPYYTRMIFEDTHKADAAKRLIEDKGLTEDK